MCVLGNAAHGFPDDHGKTRRQTRRQQVTGRDNLKQPVDKPARKPVANPYADNRFREGQVGGTSLSRFPRFGVSKPVDTGARAPRKSLFR